MRGSGRTISCPQSKSYISRLASSTDTTRCGCVGAGVSTLRRKRARQTGTGRPPIRGRVQKAHSEDRGRKAHGQTEQPELSGAQRGPGCRQDAARAGNTVARTQHDRGGRMARACIPAGMRCTCLKLRDLVSACESSSSSGSPSGPPASSSPAPAPRTADHVHLAHCTGDRICQGLNAMSAAAAPAVGTAASFLQNGGAVTGAGDPRMWLQRASAVGPGAALPPTARSAARPRSSEPPRHTRAPARPRSPACPLPLSLPPCAAWLWGRLPPRAAWATAEPRPWSRPLGPNYWRGARGRRLGRLWGALPPPRWSRPALLRQGLPDRPAVRARSPSPLPPPPAGTRASSSPRRRRPFPSVCALLRLSSSPFYLFFLPLRLNGVADAGPHRS